MRSKRPGIRLDVREAAIGDLAELFTTKLETRASLRSAPAGSTA